MAATAQFKEFGPFFLNGALVTAPHIFHYVVGTTTLKDAYADRGKLATVAQPLVGDANGLASAYWDGLYKIIVKTSDEATILATWDQVQISEPPEVVPSTAWTPTFTCLTPGDLSISYAFRQGEYYKIGDLTWVAIHLIFTPTFTTAVGQITVTGCPYGYDGNADPTSPAIIATGSDPALSTHYAYAATISTVNEISFRTQGVGTYSNLTIGLFTSGVQCQILCALAFRGSV